jgi:RNA polymerase sigma factor (sigma-70 family)
VKEAIPEVAAVGNAMRPYPPRSGRLAVATPDALEVFVSQHYARLIRLAGLICRSVDEAEDAVQSSIERAWRNRTALNDPTKLRSWLDRIVVREAIRAKGSRLTTVPGLALDRRGNELADDGAAVRIAFGQLSVDHRAAIVLHLYMGYTVNDTASILGARTETIRSRLREARERLRYILALEA